MAGPWEQYQSQPSAAADGPWSKYQTADAAVHDNGADKGGPAPRWDFMGDTGRAAEAAAGSMEADFHNAFPSLKDRKAQQDQNFQEHGFWGGLMHNEMGSGGRMLSLAKLPLDALAIITSPLTGALHAGVGSALATALPTNEGKPPVRALDDPSRGPVMAALGRFEKNYLPAPPEFSSDPKKAADEMVDQAMVGLGPRVGPVGDTAALAEASKAAEARATTKTTNRAIQKVNARAASDKLTAQQVLDAQAAANAAGDKVTLMDLGDKNVRGLAGAVYRAPGDAGKEIGDFLTARDNSATPSLTQEVQGSVAKGSTYNAVQDLIKGRSVAARPAYDAAEAIGPIHSDRLQRFLDTPEVQSGLKRGLKLERQNSIAEDRPFKDSDYAVTGYKDGNLDEPLFDKVPTMKSMIVANEGLGAQIAEMVDQRTGRLTKDGVALKNFRDAFQRELDSLSGGKYKAARDTWSGPAQSMEAVKDGRVHFSRPESNEQLKAEFGDLSPSDKEFYRLGAAEAKIDQLERAPDASDKSKRIINSERDRKRFRMLFNSDAEANKFISSVARKRQMFDTKTAITGNSATAGRIAEDEDHAGTALDILHMGASAASGNWLGTLGRLYQMKKDLGMRNNPELNSQIAKILTDHNLTVDPTGRNLLSELPVPRGRNIKGVPPAAIIFGQSASLNSRTNN